MIFRARYLLFILTALFVCYRPAAALPADVKLPAALAISGLLLIPLEPGLEARQKWILNGKAPDSITSAVNDCGTLKVIGPALGGMYLFGKPYDRQTATVAAAALADATVLTEGIKQLTGRARPNVAGEAGEFTGPALLHPGTYCSFPSGHTSAAFSVATVLAERYPRQKWLYYGLATAVGVARVRSQAHFDSDVLVGAAIGIYMGRHALRDGGFILRGTNL